MGWAGFINAMLYGQNCRCFEEYDVGLGAVRCIYYLIVFDVMFVF